MNRSCLLAVLVMVGCSSRTELMLGIATDMAAPDSLDEVRLEMSRAGTGVPQTIKSWLITGTSDGFNLPGSFGIYTEGEALPVEITLTGFKSSAPIIKRTARMTLVEGETLFYRMGLTSRCMGKMDCPNGTDCVEGTCQAIEIRSAELPDFDPELVTHISCQSGATYLDTEKHMPMESLPGASACPAAQCGEGTCLAPVADPCGNCPANTTCVEGKCIAPMDDPCSLCTANQTCVNNECVGTGALHVTLSWQLATDVDLYVKTPTGALIYFGNKVADTGTLDVDDMGMGTHVENVFFTQPPTGIYEVWASNFTGSMMVPYSIDVQTPAGSLSGYPMTGTLPAMMVDSAHSMFTFSGAAAPGTP